MTTSVAAVLNRVGVTRVIHFTPAKNLDGILRDGMLRDSEQLDEDGQPHHTPTDASRIDSRRNLICCSFEYPNAYYQHIAKGKAEFANYPGWVCLVLEPDLVTREGTLFYPCNAAKAGGRYGEAGGDGMLAMWANPSVPGGYRRRNTHIGAVPTDVQAEVQIPGPIALSAVTAIVTSTPEYARELFGYYHAMGLHPERLEWRSAPLFFSKFELTDAIHFSRPIVETVWAPAAEDLA